MPRKKETIKGRVPRVPVTAMPGPKKKQKRKRGGEFPPVY